MLEGTKFLSTYLGKRNGSANHHRIWPNIYVTPRISSLLSFLIENKPRLPTFFIQQCINSFSHGCDTVLHKATPGGRLAWAHSPRAHSPSWWTNPAAETWGHIAPWSFLDLGLWDADHRVDLETVSKTCPEFYSKRHQVDNVSQAFPIISHTKKKWQASLFLLLLLVTLESHVMESLCGRATSCIHQKLQTKGKGPTVERQKRKLPPWKPPFLQASSENVHKMFADSSLLLILLILCRCGFTQPFKSQEIKASQWLVCRQHNSLA